MAYKYIGDSTLGVGLTVTAPKPLDNRTVVNDINNLYSIPKGSAYQGMTVANVQDGNIYMLIDKNKIEEKAGWKASYESLLIITCSLEEYDQWQSNTSPEYTPIHPELPYIYPNTYYYIYERDDDLYYLSAGWGKEIEKLLRTKAAESSVQALNTTLNLLQNNLTTNYLTSESIQNNYVPKTDLNLESPESFLSTTLANYYTIIAADTKFVTKEELRGDAPEGLDDFVFVTKKQYIEDKQNTDKVLDTTLKTNTDGSLNSITTDLIKSKPNIGGRQLTVDVKPEGLYIGEDPIAKKSEIPIIVTLSNDDYDKLDKEQLLDPNTYYYIYDIKNEDIAYITNEYLIKNYDNRGKYQEWCGITFYTKLVIDEKLALKADADKYYTSEISDSKYLSISNAQNTYATKESLALLDTDIKTNYVTKEDLKGSATEGDDDFIFVTLTKYDADKASYAKSITTLTLNTTDAKTTNLELNTAIVKFENNYLTINSEKIAPLKEVPKIVCLTDTDYEKLEPKSDDTYYYTYSATLEKDNGYVTYKYLDSTYYKKALVELLIVDIINPYKERISNLEKQVLLLTDIVSLLNSKLDSIQELSNSTLISNDQLLLNKWK